MRIVVDSFDNCAYGLQFACQEYLTAPPNLCSKLDILPERPQKSITKCLINSANDGTCDSNRAQLTVNSSVMYIWLVSDSFSSSSIGHFMTHCYVESLRSTDTTDSNYGVSIILRVTADLGRVVQCSNMEICWLTFCIVSWSLEVVNAARSDLRQVMLFVRIENIA